VRSEDRVNEVNVGEMFLAKENGVLTSPAEARDTDFEVGVFGAEDGEEVFDDGTRDGTSVEE
jgi:hypothetical protein